MSFNVTLHVQYTLGQNWFFVYKIQFVSDALFAVFLRAEIQIFALKQFLNQQSSFWT